MQSDLPAPLVSAEVDLRDFAFMPLDVLRLRDSQLASTVSGDAFRAAVLLWCAAWHQVPAGSLPDDELVLAHFAGYGRDIRGYRKISSAAQHGFLRCSDGRLYHSVIAEKANEAWQAKQRQRARTAAATASRITKQPERNVDRNEPRNVTRHDARDDDRNVQREKQHSAQRYVHQGTVDRDSKEKPTLSGGQKEKSSRKTQIAADWLPSPPGYAYALDKAGWQHQRAVSEAEHFRDHHRAKANTFADIDAAWRTWVRNGATFAGKGNGAKPPELPKLTQELWDRLSDTERARYVPGYMRPS